MIQRLGQRIAVTLLALGTPTLAVCQTPDSLTKLLNSPQWQVRAMGVDPLIDVPMADLPSGLGAKVVALLDSEALALGSTPASQGTGEGYGEYLISLAELTLRFHDPASLRGMALVGIKTSRDAQDFVASQGAPALPFLDESLSRIPSGHSAVAETWALMVGKYAAQFSPDERLQVLHRILLADTLDIIGAAELAPLPALMPLLDSVVVTGRNSVVQSAAAQALDRLRPQRDALTSSDLATMLSDLAGAICVGSQGARQDACASLFSRLASITASIGESHPLAALDTLTALAAAVDSGHAAGIWSDGERQLLAANASYLVARLSSATTASVYLHGAGGTANPPTLSLFTAPPTGTTAKYKDSPGINFNNGNPWTEIGTWTAPPAVTNGRLSSLGDADLWIGLKNSDDIGTNFDLRVEVLKNGVLVASGETLCVQGVTRNANQAKEVAVPFATFSPTAFDGTADALALKVLTRVGTTGSGVACGGHHNAVGLRLYFDATSRTARFAVTF